MEIISLTKDHFPAVAAIYKQGLATGIASFETEVPNWEQWNQKFLETCRFVLVDQGIVLGWCALSATSKRKVYRGVAEDTIYLDASHQGKGMGKILLTHLVTQSEIAGFWTLQAAIFPQNTASIALHKTCGFRVIGVREQVAQRDGVWQDNVLMERRSKKFN